MNHQLDWQIFHWRSRDGEEIDFLIQKSPVDFLFIEAKVTPAINVPIAFLTDALQAN